MSAIQIRYVRNVTDQNVPLHLDKIRAGARCDAGVNENGTPNPPCPDCQEPTHDNQAYTWAPGEVLILFDNVATFFTQHRDYMARLKVVGKSLSLDDILASPTGVFTNLPDVDPAKIRSALKPIGRGGSSEGVGERLEDVRQKRRFVSAVADFGEGDSDGSVTLEGMMGQASVTQPEPSM